MFKKGGDSIITKEKILKYLIKPFLVVMMIAGFILAIQYTYTFGIISLLALAVLWCIDIWEKKQMVKHAKELIRARWGTDHIEKRDFKSIRRFYDFDASPEANKNDSEEFILDDITWRDLNMDSVFAKVDHTNSLPGVQKLYDLLRKPLFNGEDLEKRARKIDSFIENKEVANDLQYPLNILSKKDSKELFIYFQNGMNVDSKYAIVYRIMGFLPFLALLGLLVNQQLAFGIFIMAMSTNSLIYQKVKGKVYQEMDSFNYISRLIKAAQAISKVDTGSVDIEKEKLDSLIKSTRAIYKNVSSLNTGTSARSEIQLLVDYVNMIFLRETIKFYKTINLINKHRDDIIDIYKLLGEIDAYISIASYKDGLDYYVEPELIEDGDSFYINVEELYHPLLEDPVPYSFELDNKGALVTGSNASGKSTYLRTIGVNTLLAQTFYITLAKSYKSNYYRLLTSIGTTDSIEEGDSYFMAEAKSLKRIVNSLDSDHPVLCILDEIFRGTNTAERISAAKEVLNYMIDRNTLVVAATHDLELTSMVNENFHNYHFKESIQEHDITFDYILRHGPATSRNAIAILRYLGYPKIIYENADKTVVDYQKNGYTY
nr:hypothetical protein [Tissierella sp.]